MECAVAMDWIVDEKNYLSLSANDEALDSPYVPTSFTDGGYCIRIFVNETNGYNSKEKYVSFFLSLNEEYLIDANVTLSIPSANFCDNFTSKYESRETNLISHESFFDPKNGYFQNGKLTVQLRGSLTYIIRKTHEIKPIKNVGEILWKSDGKDFTIELDDGEIKAHKFVLRERSPYFAGMFDSGMKESRENKVAIEGFPFKIVETAIKICYDCEISNTFSVDDYLFLLKFSDLYDIEHVKTFVECFLADVISRDNVCSIANASVEFNAEKLRLCCNENLKEFIEKFYYKHYDNGYKVIRRPTFNLPGFDSLDGFFKDGFSASLKKKIQKIIM